MREMSRTLLEQKVEKKGRRLFAALARA